MTYRTTLLTLALTTLVCVPGWAAPPSAHRGQCTDISLLLIVAPQTIGQGGISGDGISIYDNPNDPAFNGGTLYEDGVGGASVKFLVCNGSNDFVLNVRGTSPVRYLNLDFSYQLSPPDTADGAVDLTNKQYQQQGEQVNEMANAALYSNGGLRDVVQPSLTNHNS